MPVKPPLPRFDDPPVIETVLSVEFLPVVKWDVPYFGIYWEEKLRGQFPDARVLPPIFTQIETFGPPQQVEPQMRMMSRPEVRCWFVTADERQLLQIQNNRFIFNWKKAADEDVYPHYDKVIRPRFLEEWNKFQEFVKTRALGELSVVQCEVSYINHLEIKKGWHSAADLGKVFTCLSADSNGSFLPAPEDIDLSVRYLMPEKRGRLRVSAKPAIRNTDGAEIIQFVLTAKGAPAGSSTDQVMQWIDEGREWVVRGFADFTTPEMQKLWKRRQ